jgi:sulfotransferase
MRKFNVVSGLPRAGSTLLCQLLNSNAKFHVTPTSATIDMLRNMRSTFSHNPTYKGQNRLQLLENFRRGLKGFLDGYFYDKDVVFDKCRGWSNNIALLDAIMGDNQTKILWCYRNPVEIIGSIEAQYQRTILLENADESVAAGAFATLDRRIGTYINGDGIVSFPVEILRDAIEMGYSDRILFIKYIDLTTKTQDVMNAIHAFIGEEKHEYDVKNVKQTTWENDGAYNYKFMHRIKEGEIIYKKSDITLPPKYANVINERYFALNKLVLEGDPSALLGIPQQQQQEPSQPAPEGDKNPFKVD